MWEEEHVVMQDLPCKRQCFKKLTIHLGIKDIKNTSLDNGLKHVFILQVKWFEIVEIEHFLLLCLFKTSA